MISSKTLICCLYLLTTATTATAYGGSRASWDPADLVIRDTSDGPTSAGHRDINQRSIHARSLDSFYLKGYSAGLAARGSPPDRPIESIEASDRAWTDSSPTALKNEITQVTHGTAGITAYGEGQSDADIRKVSENAMNLNSAKSLCAEDSKKLGQFISKIRRWQQENVIKLKKDGNTDRAERLRTASEEHHKAYIEFAKAIVAASRKRKLGGKDDDPIAPPKEAEGMKENTAGVAADFLEEAEMMKIRTAGVIAWKSGDYDIKKATGGQIESHVGFAVLAQQMAEDPGQFDKGMRGLREGVQTEVQRLNEAGKQNEAAKAKAAGAKMIKAYLDFFNTLAVRPGVGEPKHKFTR